MSSYGLKTNIAVNVAVLIFFGMLLTAFMMVNLFQRLLVNSEIEKCLYAVTAIEELISTVDPKGGSKEERLKYNLRKMLFNLKLPDSVVVFPDLNKRYEFCEDYSNIKEMEKQAEYSFTSDSRKVTEAGKGWGVFWKHKTDLMVSAPLYRGDTKIAGICIKMPLKIVFKNIRNVISMIFLYIGINALILTFAGVYQISKTAVRPVHRLLKRANEYHDENTSVIFEEKTGNEFKKLSSALNNMLGRISNDKKKLVETVHSLEISNVGLKKAQKDIVRAEKLASVGRLSSGIAHEIGNPLGIVGGYLELIKDEQMPPDKKQDFIERAEKEIERIDGIIRQLLDYSRKSTDVTSVVKVNELITDVVEMIKIQPFMKTVNLEVATGKEDFHVMADYNQLRQVLLNLSMNAADAIVATEGKKDGCIRISLESAEGDKIKIIFEDNGTGISGENIGNVFDPFFTTKEPGKGTGLGLSVCFMIIESFDGEIKIESEEDKGTRVFIELQSAKNVSS